MKYLVLISLVMLTACGPARIHRMDQSNAAYKTCLAANPKKLSACEVQRLSYEADKQAVKVTMPGLLVVSE